MAEKEERRLDLRWQFAILVGLLVVITSTGLTWLLVATERANLYQEFQTSLVDQGRTIARMLSPSALDPDAGEDIVRALAEAREDNPNLTGACYFDDRGGIYSADEEIVPFNVGGEPVELGVLRAREELVS
ncbi:MAG: hypothetical protein NTW26_08140, partial [bacterium]|nr:hypothetical protein [bacterium]